MLRDCVPDYRGLFSAAGEGEGAWRRDDLGSVDDRLSDSESICRRAAFLRRNRRHTRGRTCGVDYRFVHFS